MKSNINVNIQKDECKQQAVSTNNNQQEKKALKTPKIRDILVLLCRYMEGALGYGIESKAKNIKTECHISVSFLK